MAFEDQSEAQSKCLPRSRTRWKGGSSSMPQCHIMCTTSRFPPRSSTRNRRANKARPPRAITVLGQVENGGYAFTNFNGPNAGTNAGDGTTMNGISNYGHRPSASTIDNSGNFHNYIVNLEDPGRSPSSNINGSTTAMANGINSSGTVVGTDGNGNAFFETNGKVKTFIPTGGMSRGRFRDQRQGNDRRPVRDLDHDARVHQGKQQDFHRDQCTVRARRRQRPGHQQQGPGGRVLSGHGRPGPRLHGQ